MEVRYGEDRASHTDPKPCVVFREGLRRSVGRGKRRPAIELRNHFSGVPTYTPIAGLGPFAMVQLGGVWAGSWYYITPATALAVLNADAYMNTTICHIVSAGGGSPPNMMAVQPRQVIAEYNPA